MTWCHTSPHTLSMYVNPSVCLCIYLFVRLLYVLVSIFQYQYNSMFIYFSVYLSICLSICPLLCLHTRLFYQSICWYIFLSYLYNDLSVNLSISVPDCLICKTNTFIHPFFNILVFFFSTLQFNIKFTSLSLMLHHLLFLLFSPPPCVYGFHPFLWYIYYSYPVASRPSSTFYSPSSPSSSSSPCRPVFHVDGSKLKNPACDSFSFRQNGSPGAAHQDGRWLLGWGGHGNHSRPPKPYHASYAVPHPATQRLMLLTSHRNCGLDSNPLVPSL